jgi:hypothetical protein
MNVVLTILLTVQMLSALAMIGLILGAAWQRCGYGRGLWQRRFRELVWCQWQCQLSLSRTTAVAGNCVFCLHVGVGVFW